MCKIGLGELPLLQAHLLVRSQMVRSRRELQAALAVEDFLVPDDRAELLKLVLYLLSPAQVAKIHAGVSQVLHQGQKLAVLADHALEVLTLQVVDIPNRFIQDLYLPFKVVARASTHDQMMTNLIGLLLDMRAVIVRENLAEDR